MQSLTLFNALLLPLVWASPCLSEKHTRLSSFSVGQSVNTSSGLVSGHASTSYSEVSEYLGIPFAQPPVGDLRFAAPLKYTGSSALDGSEYGNMCAQVAGYGSNPTAEQIALANITEVGLELLNITSVPGTKGGVISEDCLYLNVWSKPQSGEAGKAVMMFIHGGGFTGGSASHMPITNGGALADQQDVVVVTLNYRVSILGFPGSPTTTNNLAFLDQRLAVEWVRDNIANFGGDPTRITLFGQSAGSESLDYYGYAYAPDPIVTGLIAQSGTVQLSGLPFDESTAAASWYGVTAAVGCGNATTDDAALMACMRALPFETILSAIPTSGLNAIFSPFGPTVDNITVFADYSQQPPASIPMLLGNNDNEMGLFKTELALGNVTLPDYLWDDMSLVVFSCTTGARANLSIAAGNPTWRYRFHAVFPNTNISSEGGAYHGAEMTLVFGNEFETPASTAQEIEVADYVQGAWVAFAKDPVNGLVNYEGGWPQYDPAKETLIRLGYNDSVGTNLALPELYDAQCADVTYAELVCVVFGEC
ncbi:unnamed protein product [Discula destructiva]